MDRLIKIWHEKVHTILLVYSNKEDEKGVVCRAHGRDEKWLQNSSWKA
jgi:hypothetical protein